MTDETQDFANHADLREKAPSRWDSGGGAGSVSISAGRRPFEPTRDVPELATSELNQHSRRKLYIYDIRAVLRGMGSPR